jgi:hypothetical protein
VAAGSGRRRLGARRRRAQSTAAPLPTLASVGFQGKETVKTYKTLNPSLCRVFLPAFCGVLCKGRHCPCMLPLSYGLNRSDIGKVPPPLGAVAALCIMPAVVHGSSGRCLRTRAWCYVVPNNDMSLGRAWCPVYARYTGRFFWGGGYLFYLISPYNPTCCPVVAHCRWVFKCTHRTPRSSTTPPTASRCSSMSSSALPAVSGFLGGFSWF